LEELIRAATARGVSQHWVVVPGGRRREIALLADRLGVEIAV